jgi:hypothetical protein
MKSETPNLDSLETLMQGSLQEIAQLRKAKELLFDVYFEADRSPDGKLSWDTIREIHCFLGFDKGEDE